MEEEPSKDLPVVLWGEVHATLPLGTFGALSEQSPPKANSHPQTPTTSKPPPASALAAPTPQRPKPHGYQSAWCSARRQPGFATPRVTS